MRTTVHSATARGTHYTASHWTNTDWRYSRESHYTFFQVIIVQCILIECKCIGNNVQSVKFLLTVSAPELRLPMDVTDNRVLLGDITGTLHGGASTIPGKVGFALHTSGNDQYVDYGLHLDKCYQNPDKCGGGITFALWLNVHAYDSVILDTGAMDSGSIGYYIFITPEHSIKISVKDTSMYHQYEAPQFPLNEWVHLVFTWPSHAGLVHLYINGCDADATNEKGYAYNLARFSSLSSQYKFLLGAALNGIRSYAHADMDELLFWDRVLQPLEVWQMFVDGGVVRYE